MKYLLGDNHLARLTTGDLPGLGVEWLNFAKGGYQCTQVTAMLLDLPDLTRDDVVILSLGTNDSAPWKRVPLQVFESHLDQIFRGLFPAHLAYLVPPGVDEARLTGAHDRTNSSMARWANAAVALADEHDLLILDLPGGLEPLGAAAYEEDGVHLSPAGTRVLVELLQAAARRFEEHS